MKFFNRYKDVACQQTLCVFLLSSVAHYFLLRYVVEYCDIAMSNTMTSSLNDAVTIDINYTINDEVFLRLPQPYLPMTVNQLDKNLRIEKEEIKTFAHKYNKLPETMQS